MIALQSVKEVVQSLIDDNLVITDKIGISNYYWSFPSVAIQSVINYIYKNTKSYHYLT